MPTFNKHLYEFPLKFCKFLESTTYSRSTGTLLLDLLITFREKSTNFVPRRCNIFSIHLLPLSYI